MRRFFTLWPAVAFWANRRHNGNREAVIFSGTTLPRLFLFGALFVGATGLGLVAMDRLFAVDQLRFDAKLLSVDVVVPVLALLVIYYCSDALRLQFILRTMGQRLPFRAMVQLVFLNLFFSNITPMATGGGVAQIVYLRRLGVHVGVATAATTVRTVLAAVTIFTGALAFLVLEPALSTVPSLGRIAPWLGTFAGLYLAVFMVLMFRPRWLLTGVARLLATLEGWHLLTASRRRRWQRSLHREALRLGGGFRAFVRAGAIRVVASLFFTLVFLACLFSFSAVLLWGLEYDTAYGRIVGLQLVTTLVMYFSPTPGAAGIAEGLYGKLFSGVVAAEHVLLVTVMWRFLTVHLGMLIGMLLFKREIIGLGSRYVRQRPS